MKKLESERFYRDFSADLKSHPLPQRPCAVMEGDEIFKDVKKIDKSVLDLYFFTASDSLATFRLAKKSK